MRRVRIGIDIGKSGGIALFVDGVCLAAVSTPQIAGEIDVVKLVRMIRDWIPTKQDSFHVAIEDVHAIYGCSAKATFQFGKALGVIEGILTALEVSWTKVTPKMWQKEMWQGVEVIKKAGKTSNDTKAMSLIAVKRLFPALSLLETPRCSVPHNGIVDSVLIGAYCSRKL